MALTKQTIPISFASGVDTKTDPRQVVAGKLLIAENVILTTAQEFQKRNGYLLLASLNSGIDLATYKNELVAMDGTSLQTLSPSTNQMVNKGNLTTVQVSAGAIYRNSYNQTAQDSSVHPNGVTTFVWNDSLNGATYLVISNQTQAEIIPATLFPGAATQVRVFALGNYVVMTYIDALDHHLKYISFNTSNPISTVSSPVDIATNVHTSNSNYDATLANNALYLSWNASDGGGAVRSKYLDSSLNIHSGLTVATMNANSDIALFVDKGVSPPQIYAVCYDGTNIKYFVYDVNLSLILSTATAVSNTSNIQNINGWANNGVGTIYYQNLNNYSGNGGFSGVPRSDFISQVSITVNGSIGSTGVFLRSVGLVSKCFKFGSRFYFVVVYIGTFESTYFVVDHIGNVVAKVAYTNAGGYVTSNVLTGVSQVSLNVFTFSYLYKDQLTTQSGAVYTATGVNAATLTFNTNLSQVELGNNLNLGAGYLSMYDGSQSVEQNFHYSPQDTYQSNSFSTGGHLGSQTIPTTYNYAVTYEWTDNQGQIHRSLPSVAALDHGSTVSFSAGQSSGRVLLGIPTLRLTGKQGVRIGVYRTQANGSIYYAVTSTSAPLLSTTSSDAVFFNDTLSDSSLAGQPLLYTTGGVVPDTGVPSSPSMALFKNRLFLLDGENPNTYWFSKLTLPNTPVEMSDEFTSPLDPRFGAATALSVMDDKLIVFKANAIFYIVGSGPDNTGNQNDLSEAVFVSSTVGTTNPKSIVLTPDGLMFSSNKGIWLLDRSLNVSYIGAPVEAYNSYAVTSSNLIPNTTQVRFTLSNNQALVYDYYYRQWIIFTNHSAVGAVIYNNLFTYLKATGQLLQESNSTYTDNGVPIFMKIQTGWIQVGGFQGFQRMYRGYLIAKYLTPHVLNVGVSYDFNPSITQNILITPSLYTNGTWGSDKFWGSNSFWGGPSQVEQYRLNFQTQRCQAIQVTIQEGLDTSNPVYGAGLALEGLALVVGVKGTFPRLPAVQTVT